MDSKGTFSKIWTPRVLAGAQVVGIQLPWEFLLVSAAGSLGRTILRSVGMGKRAIPCFFDDKIVMMMTSMKSASYRH